MKTELNVKELIKKFEDMAKRGTLLARGDVTQEDLLIQIVGTIVNEAMKEDNEKDENLYIITNTTSSGNYTPSIANSLESAMSWMYKCTADNIRNFKQDEYPELKTMSNIDVCLWAEENLPDIEIEDFQTYIGYSDGNYNCMQIFKLSDCISSK